MKVMTVVSLPVEWPDMLGETGLVLELIEADRSMEPGSEDT